MHVVDMCTSQVASKKGTWKQFWVSLDELAYEMSSSNKVFIGRDLKGNAKKVRNVQ